MRLSHTMHTIRFLLAAVAFSFSGCANFDNPFENTNRDMTPLEGSGETPTIRNRFPESRGGFPLSRADREDRDMTRMERLKQY